MDAQGYLRADLGNDVLGRRSVALDAPLQDARDRAEQAGRTVIAVGGILVVADTVKPTSPRAIAELAELGLRPMLRTGDNERAARTVAAEVGIDEAIAEVLPGRKVDVVPACRATAGWSPWSATG